MLDDHAIVRYGMASRLSTEPYFLIVGNYESSRDMIAGLRKTPADVLLIDYSLGPTEIDGISLIRVLRIKYPKSHILVLSSHYTPDTVTLALRMGARGFVGKGQDLEEVVRAIRTVSGGGIYLNESMAYQLGDASIPTPQEVGGRVNAKDTDDPLITGSSLSMREREVIRCFLDGMTVGEIAKKFGRSIKTISTQKSTAFRKLGVTSDNGLFKIKHLLEKS